LAGTASGRDLPQVRRREPAAEEAACRADDGFGGSQRCGQKTSDARSKEVRREPGDRDEKSTRSDTPAGWCALRQRSTAIARGGLRHELLNEMVTRPLSHTRSLFTEWRISARTPKVHLPSSSDVPVGPRGERMLISDGQSPRNGSM